MTVLDDVTEENVIDRIDDTNVGFQGEFGGE
jgi:hypothetical protein